MHESSNSHNKYMWLKGEWRVGFLAKLISAFVLQRLGVGVGVSFRGHKSMVIMRKANLYGYNGKKWCDWADSCWKEGCGLNL